MAERETAGSIDEYIAGFPPEVRERLEQLREIVRTLAPDATESISYAIPTFDLNGRHLVHFAAFSKHIGLYPTPTGIEAFKEDLSTYKTSKGAVQLPHDRELPLELIRRIVEFRLAENAGRPAK